MSRPTDGFSAITRVFTRLRVAQGLQADGSTARSRHRDATVPPRARLEGVPRDRSPELAVAERTPPRDSTGEGEPAARVDSSCRPTTTRTSTTGRSASRSSPTARCGSWARPSCSSRCSGRSCAPPARSPCAAAKATGMRSGPPSSSRARARSSPSTPRAPGVRRASRRSARPDGTRAPRASHSPRASRSCRPRSAAPSASRSSRAIKVIYGDPIPLDDLADQDARRAVDRGHRTALQSDRRARAAAVTRPLLAVDGDSFAHRAHHALPSSITRAEGKRAGAIVGFTNMLVAALGADRAAAGRRRLGHADAPRPTGTRRSRRTSRGASSTTRCSSSSTCCRSSSRRSASTPPRRPGTRRTISSARRSRSEEGRGGTVLVATSDRDMFQLASERTTLLMPRRASRSIERVGPERCASATASSRRRCPISSRCAAIRRTSSRARPASGRRRRPTAAQAVRDPGGGARGGRFSAIAEDLRLYRRIATVDASAPLPSLDDRSPTWAEASALVQSLGDEPAGRTAGRPGLAWTSSSTRPSPSCIRPGITPTRRRAMRRCSTTSANGGVVTLRPSTTSSSATTRRT